MCLGIPLKIIEIDGKNAVGEANGIKRSIRIDCISDIAIGEYVMVHAGFALEKMSKKDALDTIDAFSEVEKAINADEK